jgi:molybdopterin converting factor small subunit
VAKVVLTGGLSEQFGVGSTEMEYDVANVRQLLRQMEERHPGLGKLVEEQMAIAIDGEIFQDPFLEPIGSDSEVFILPRLGGG